MIDQKSQNHWDKVYGSKDVTQLGWYEEIPAQCLKLVKSCNLRKDDAVIDAGAGASTFIDSLIDTAHKHIIAVDISGEALGHLRNRLGPEKSSKVTWVVDDIADPIHLRDHGPVMLWHDRAVLHFLLIERERNGYLKTMKRMVKAGGYVIIAVFSLTGAIKCSGLDVRRYDENMISEFLGKDFRMLDHFEYLYHTPSNSPRPYVYTLFRRIA